MSIMSFGLLYQILQRMEITSPISSNNVLLDLEYFGRTVLFNYADFLLKEHEIYMFTK